MQVSPSHRAWAGTALKGRLGLNHRHHAHTDCAGLLLSLCATVPGPDRRTYCKGLFCRLREKSVVEESD
jgi:hypothetical protein